MSEMLEKQNYVKEGGVLVHQELIHVSVVHQELINVNKVYQELIIVSLVHQELINVSVVYQELINVNTPGTDHKCSSAGTDQCKCS